MLADNVEDTDLHVGCTGDVECDGRRRVERIRIVLLQRKLPDDVGVTRGDVRNGVVGRSRQRRNVFSGHAAVRSGHDHAATIKRIVNGIHRVIYIG